MIKILVVVFISGFFGHIVTTGSQATWIRYEDSEDKSCRIYRISHEGMPFTDVYTVCQKGVISK